MFKARPSKIKSIDQMISGASNLCGKLKMANPK